MPCDTVRVISTIANFEKLDFDRLVAAATTVGLVVRRGVKTSTTGENVVVETVDGYRATQDDVAKLRSAYAAETVKAGLKRFGWKIKTQATETEDRVGVVTRLKAGRPVCRN